jgi:glycosyltransferase involved in cell wall biosynthesis
MQPDFSIITVVRNAVTTIERTVTSVTSQDGPLVEYIVVDGASTDGTLAWLEEHRTLFTKFVSEKDRGIYDAMNKGIRLATGRWLAFLNADDYYTDTSVLKDIQNFAQYLGGSADLIYGKARIVDENVGKSYVTGKRIRLSSLYHYQRIVHQATFFRRDVFETVGLYNDTIRGAGDYEWYIRYFASQPDDHSSFVDRIVVNFTCDSASYGFYLDNFLQRKKLAKKYFPLWVQVFYLIKEPLVRLKGRIIRNARGSILRRFYRSIKLSLIHIFHGNPQTHTRGS